MMSRIDFDCKIAHLDEIKRIAGFNSIKELYDQVSRTFLISQDQILYCTLNTHDFRDMDSLLGSYLSMGDLIIVHLCGNKKELSLKKTQEYLGLTITDNGIGRAFVKKVKSNDGQIEELIQPGEHIASINSESTVGLRHYEVAKTIRSIPLMTNFTMQLVEPLYSEKYLNGEVHLNLENRPKSDLSGSSARENISLLSFGDGSSQLQSRTSNGEGKMSRAMEDVLNGTGSISDSIYEDLTNSSLPIDRLLSKGTNLQQNDYIGQASNLDPNEKNSQDSYRTTIDKINSILESFLGINDNTLAIQIYRLAIENRDSLSKFSRSIEKSELGVFNFNEDIKTYLWNSATHSDRRLISLKNTTTTK